MKENLSLKRKLCVIMDATNREFMKRSNKIDKATEDVVNAVIGCMQMMQVALQNQQQQAFKN